MKPISYLTQLKKSTTDLILVSFTKKEIEDFDIYPYNSFERARYFCVDTGDGQQVVFALDLETGKVEVEEDTDSIGIETSFNSVSEFISRYRQLTKRQVMGESYKPKSIYKTMNKINDNESLNEKYNVKKSLRY